MIGLREWLLSKLSDSVQIGGDDELILGFINQVDAATAELADLKQRLLPQYLGRAERAENAKHMAEHDRDALLEQLMVAEKRVADQMTGGVATWAQAWKEQK